MLFRLADLVEKHARKVEELNDSLVSSSEIVMTHYAWIAEQFERNRDMHRKFAEHVGAVVPSPSLVDKQAAASGSTRTTLHQ